jgi:hypothetical protein
MEQPGEGKLCFKVTCFGAYCPPHGIAVNVKSTSMFSHYKQKHPEELRALGRVSWKSEAAMLTRQMHMARHRVMRGVDSILQYMSDTMRTSRGYRCPTCGDVFTRRQTGLRHVQRKHPREDSAEEMLLERPSMLFGSVCSRWVDADVCMRDFPLQRNILR